MKGAPDLKFYSKLIFILALVLLSSIYFIPIKNALADVCVPTCTNNRWLPVLPQDFLTLLCPDETIHQTGTCGGTHDAVGTKTGCGSGTAGDTTQPLVTAFNVSATNGLVTATYSVTDNVALLRAELWRAPYDVVNCSSGKETSCSWGFTPVSQQPISGISYNGSLTDSPAVGVYWYGIHAVDTAVPGNVGYEPNPPGPIQVTVTADNTPPVFTSFNVQPTTPSGPVNVTFTVTDETALQKVELYRVNYNSTGCSDTDKSGCPWSTSKINETPISGSSTKTYSSSYTDSPAIGVYWYGIHALDTSNNVGVEPSPGPIKVTITPPSPPPPPPPTFSVSSPSKSIPPASFSLGSWTTISVHDMDASILDPGGISMVICDSGTGDCGASIDLILNTSTFLDWSVAVHLADLTTTIPYIRGHTYYIIFTVKYTSGRSVDVIGTPDNPATSFTINP